MLENLNHFGYKIASFFGDLSSSVSLSNSSKKIAFSQNSFSEVLPYLAYDNECGVFINNNSKGFVIEAIPLVGGDLDAYKLLHALFEEVLEEGASVQCLLWADHRIDRFLNKWEEGRQGEEIYASIAKNRVAYLKKQCHSSPRLFRFILSYSIPTTNIESDKSNKLLLDIKEKIFKTLRSITYAYHWKPKDLLETIGGLVNFDTSTEVIRRTWNQYENLANQIPCGGQLLINKHSLEWENKTLLKTFRVVDTPNDWPPIAMGRLIGDMFRDTLRINHPFFIHYGVHCPSQTKAENSFWRRSQFLERQAKTPGLLRYNPELAGELKESDFVRNIIKQGSSRFVWTQLSTGIWAEEKELQQATQSIKSIFRINNFRLEENTRIHLPQFLSILPLTWSEYVEDLKNLNVLKTTITSECPCFVPIQGEWTGTHSNNGILLMGRRGQLLNWNPFDSTSGNYNCVVSGKSGSGKSVFMQELMYSGLSMGANVYVLDVGRSFEKICEIFKGQHIEFSKHSCVCLNPFTNISIDDAEERGNSFSFLKSIISTMAAPNQGTSDLENSLIESAICNVWDQKKNNATVSDIADWLRNQPDEKSKNLAVMLIPYTRLGSYSKYFEGKNNVNFSNKMVLIELEELKSKPDLQAVVLQLFIMTIADKAFLGDRKTPFFICIDEAWDLLRAKQTGPFIETLARRLRKYRGSLVVGTQNTEDFFSSPGANAAFKNSDWRCLLAEKISDMSDSSKEGLKFNEVKKRAFESLSGNSEYREIMICDGEGGYSIARLSLDPFSKLLFSTKAEDYSRIKELTSTGKTLTEAIEKILEQGTTNA